MSEEERRVDLVRVPREEQIFEREDVFGRDASSVFPTEFKKQQQQDMDAMKEAIGAKKFISETELLEMKAGSSNADDSGADGANRPLVEILRERKEAKEAEFQEKWKLMKQGKNKPLDEEDAEFLDNTLKADLERMRQQREEELLELHNFRQAVEARSQAEEGTSAGEEAPSLLGRPKPAAVQVPISKKPVAKPVLRAIVKARPKAPPLEDTSQPDAKKARTSADALTAHASGTAHQGQAADGADDKPLLMSLLGDYGSEHDESSSGGYNSD